MTEAQLTQAYPLSIALSLVKWPRLRVRVREPCAGISTLRAHGKLLVEHIIAGDPSKDCFWLLLLLLFPLGWARLLYSCGLLEVFSRAAYECNPVH